MPTQDLQTDICFFVTCAFFHRTECYSDGAGATVVGPPTVRRLTQLKSELRDAERRQSAEINRQSQEIARLSKDAAWQCLAWHSETGVKEWIMMDGVILYELKYI